MAGRVVARLFPSGPCRVACTSPRRRHDRTRAGRAAVGAALGLRGRTRHVRARVALRGRSGRGRLAGSTNVASRRAAQVGNARLRSSAVGRPRPPECADERDQPPPDAAPGFVRALPGGENSETAMGAETKAESARRRGGRQGQRVLRSVWRTSFACTRNVPAQRGSVILRWTSVSRRCSSRWQQLLHQSS